MTRVLLGALQALALQAALQGAAGHNCSVSVCSSVLIQTAAQIQRRPATTASLIAAAEAEEDETEVWIGKIVASGLLVGGVFGMMGAGGSTILKPVLYYGFQVQPFREAIFRGYVILFILAMAAALKGHLKGQVSWKTVGLMVWTTGLGSMLGSWQASRVSNTFQILSFAVLIIAVAAHMLRRSLAASGGGAGAGGGQSGAEAARSAVDDSFSKGDTKAPVDAGGAAGCTGGNVPSQRGADGAAASASALTTKAVVLGVFAGVLSGFMGVGGGFILVPALCELGHQMETAVPTSQAVVSLSALLGSCYYSLFVGCSLASLNTPVVLSLTLTGLSGIAVSSHVASRLSNNLRQRTFAGLLLTIAVGMIYSQARGQGG